MSRTNSDGFETSVKSPFTTSTEDGTYYPPCVSACPAHVNVQGYVSLISQGRFKESIDLIRKTIPFPAVCGRVCFSACEDNCYRGLRDEQVSIRLLKRLVADTDYHIEYLKSAEPIPKTHKESVAVIGSGPAGMTAAYNLVKMGYPVTVYEKEKKLGGMLRTHIPRYRLPESTLDAELKYIQDLGVEIKTGVEITASDWEHLRTVHEAVFVSVGAQASNSLNIPGESLDGVYKAMDMLWDVYHRNISAMSGHVVVIGGGNVALDAARTAIRLGAEKVTILYRRTRHEMPATMDEANQTLEEGIDIVELSSPVKILGEDGSVSGIECVKMVLGDVDASGRKRPTPLTGSEHVIDCKAVIMAIGQSISLDFISENATLTNRGALAVSDSMKTNMPGVFGGGDCVIGPSSVIDAIASGAIAARSIDAYLSGTWGTPMEPEYTEKVWLTDETKIDPKIRQRPRYLSPNRRVTNFEEIESNLTFEQGITEALRCLHCGPCDTCLEKDETCLTDKANVNEALCSGCGTCSTVCPYNSVLRTELGLALIDESTCKGCGTCAASCPDRAISMRRLSDDCLYDEIRPGGKQ
ncbi:FAD-dependent oxidoreductase [Candidatus Bathyarchaeota archaeon]|nr:FAD-dependent oxidoreductase [Candidatus Bathyarchaeota archaeon]